MLQENGMCILFSLYKLGACSGMPQLRIHSSSLLVCLPSIFFLHLFNIVCSLREQAPTYVFASLCVMCVHVLCFCLRTYNTHYKAE